MKKSSLSLISAFLLTISASGFASEMTINIISKDAKCSYRVLHESKSKLGLSVFEDSFSARIAASVEREKVNPRGCLDYAFIEISVNESLRSSKDVKIADQLVTFFNSMSDEQLTVETANTKNDEPHTYMIQSMNLDGTDSQESHIRVIDRTNVNFNKFQEYDDLMKRIK